MAIFRNVLDYIYYKSISISGAFHNLCFFEIPDWETKMSLGTKRQKWLYFGAFSLNVLQSNGRVSESKRTTLLGYQSTEV